MLKQLFEFKEIVFVFALLICFACMEHQSSYKLQIAKANRISMDEVSSKKEIRLLYFALFVFWMLALMLSN